MKQILITKNFFEEYTFNGLVTDSPEVIVVPGARRACRKIKERKDYLWSNSHIPSLEVNK